MCSRNSSICSKIGNSLTTLWTLVLKPGEGEHECCQSLQSFSSESTHSSDIFCQEHFVGNNVGNNGSQWLFVKNNVGNNGGTRLVVGNNDGQWLVVEKNVGNNGGKWLVVGNIVVNNDDQGLVVVNNGDQWLVVENNVGNNDGKLKQWWSGIGCWEQCMEQWFSVMGCWEQWWLVIGCWEQWWVVDDLFWNTSDQWLVVGKDCVNWLVVNARHHLLIDTKCAGQWLWIKCDFNKATAIFSN